MPTLRKASPASPRTAPLPVASELRLSAAPEACGRRSAPSIATTVRAVPAPRIAGNYGFFGRQAGPRSASSSAIGQAPSVVFEMTVEVEPDDGSCLDTNDTPVSQPTRITVSDTASSQKPRP